MTLPYHFPTHLKTINEGASIILGAVVCKQFSTAKMVGGGVNSLGFYYDFIFKHALSPSLLELIEVEMRTLIKKECELRFISMMRENAMALFAHKNHPLLALLAESQEHNILHLLQIDDFYSFCPNLGLNRSNEIGHVKLLGYETREKCVSGECITIIRVFGRAQENAKDLKVFCKAYEHLLKKRDHRVLGPQLKLFNFSSETNPFFVEWYPKGKELCDVLTSWLSKQSKSAAHKITTSGIETLKKKKLDKTPEFEFNAQSFAFASNFTQSHIQSLNGGYLNLDPFPKRLNEQGLVYSLREEEHRWGLLSNCSFVLNQTTVSCLKEQVHSELISSLHFIEQIITIFAFDAYWVLVASRQKSLKAPKELEAIEWLKKVAKAAHFPFDHSLIEEREEAVEGPRLELRVRDVLNREWKISSVGVITHLTHSPSFLKSENKQRNELALLVSCVWESLDRLIALLIERTEGRLPFWLLPEQVRLLAIGDADKEYVDHVKQQMQLKGLRVRLDLRQEKLDVKIHEAEKEKIPYLVLIGEQEVRKKKISVRLAHKNNQTQMIEIDPFLDKLYHESLAPKTELR